MGKISIPARPLSRLEFIVRRLPALKRADPQKAKKIQRAVLAILLLYKLRGNRPRPALYTSKSIRFRGIWRNWRDAGLEHLDDRALVRFCGFPKQIVFYLAEEIARDPDMHSLVPNSRYWKRVDPRARPSCDVLDVLVLVLREIATMGHQHVLQCPRPRPRPRPRRARA